MQANERLESLQVLQGQIAAMAVTGRVDLERVLYCTAGRWTEPEIRATLAMMAALGLV